MYPYGAMMIRPPPVGHCDTLTRTIRHCNDLPHVMLRHNLSYTIILWIFRPGLFRRGLIVTVMVRPAQAILLVTIRPT
jgi:hypothetical protein